ncbi:hypothetical protein evm_002359 [Chilo suppressalis]|nr:hypothetical protein evm_002359 [Chilo suppressalis]
MHIEQIIRDLSRNELTAISRRTFRGLTALKSLHLDGNQLKCIDEKAFENLKSLELLTLNNNNLTYLAVEPAAITRLHTLRLTENPLVCDCRLTRLATAIKAANIPGVGARFKIMSSARRLERALLSDLGSPMNSFAMVVTQYHPYRRYLAVECSSEAAVRPPVAAPLTAPSTAGKDVASLTIAYTHTATEIRLEQNEITEVGREYQTFVWLAFIDYKQAFDSVESWAVVQALQNARIDYRYTKLIENIYNNATMKVTLVDQTQHIDIKRGVRQGDTLSPKLFTLVLEDVFKKLSWEERGLKLPGTRLNNLRFADDIVLFSDNPDDLQTMIHELNEASLNVGLEMNLSKTKIMTNDPIPFTIKVNQSVIEKVEKYVYLGQEIKMGKENQLNEIDRRIRLMWAAYAKLGFAFKMNLTAVQKARLFDQCILPVLTYEAETWVLTKESINKIQVAQRKLERKLVGITLRDRKTNTWLRKQSGVTDAVKHIASLKWQWAGHIARKHGSWGKAVLEWRPWGEKRPRGRPQMRWKDDVRKTAGTNWMEVAQDRSRWRNLKEAYTRLVENG